MGNNSVPKFIFRLSRFPVYMVSVLGRFYCIYIYIYIYRVSQEECARLWENVPYVNANTIQF